MSARTILKHVYENGGMTEYQYERIDRVLKERERPHGEWTLTLDGCECSVCKDKTLILQMNFCPNCGAKMVKRGLRAKMEFVDDAVDGKIDLEYLKIGNTIYTQDNDKQGWTGREENK